MNASTKDKDSAYKALVYVCATMGKKNYIMGAGLPAWKIGQVATLPTLIVYLVFSRQIQRGMVSGALKG
ncbi:MAG: hypothetical protein ABSF77_09530 [Spirochaetia bacterium]|jgi:ABC-type glycerol-3-phosphate transport system permease component